MYTVNIQIKDTFRAFNPVSPFSVLSGLTFSKSLWINNTSANSSAITITEDTVTGGVYYFTYTPSVTGSHYINLFSSTAIFDANYYVTSGFNEVWTNSETAVLTSVTVSTNTLAIAQAVWGYSISGSSVTSGSMGQALSATWQIQTGKWEMISNQLNLYDKDGTTLLRVFNLFDTGGNPSLTGVVKRTPV
jgi:hypothetical protein